MPSLTHFCTMKATMSPTIIGQVPDGFRVDFPFTGTATGPHWEGARPVRGIDHARVRKDGSVALDITGVIGEGRQSVFYKATGVSKPGGSPAEAFPQELFVFETGDEDLAFLNQAVAVGFGHADGPDLTLEVWLAAAD